MKITIVGGGPGGLYFALLTKRARPDWQIEIYEQNQPLDSFGFGVVFSDETLEEFLSRDPKSYERIRDEFSYWDDIGIHYKGNEIRCSGNGFCGLSRKNLLKTLQERCAEEGVMLTFGERVDASQVKTRFADSDIIVAAAANSPAVTTDTGATARTASTARTSAGSPAIGVVKSAGARPAGTVTIAERVTAPPYPRLGGAPGRSGEMSRRAIASSRNPSAPITTITATTWS